MNQNERTVRPTIRKTLVKGLVAIAAFSLFLNITTSSLLNYGLFVLISIAGVLLYVAQKRSSTYEIGEESLAIKSSLRARKVIRYADIVDLSVSQGLLARRFNCGTIFVFLKGTRGGYRSLGGGAVEALRDVADPKKVHDSLAARLGPY